MDRNTVFEYLRMIIIAFVIAIIINFIRIAVFTPNDNGFTRFWNTITNNNRTTARNTEFSARTNSVTEDNAQNQTRYVSTNNPEPTQNFDEERLDEKGRIQIPLSLRLNLSGMSREEILNLRKQAVKSSLIFGNMNYEPSSAVFGSMTDNLPWISVNGALYPSRVTDREKTSGDTRDSIGILNPELLYYVSLTGYPENEFVPLYKPSYFFPYKVLYRPETKTIIAYIRGEKNENGEYEPIFLADSNAHDLGYKYAYMDMHNNIGFYREYADNTLSAGIKEVTGYYMHGSACGVPGGCNNYAPYWQYYNDFYIKVLPAKFNIKLWKNKPANPEDEADINFKMYFY